MWPPHLSTPRSVALAAAARPCVTLHAAPNTNTAVVQRCGTWLWHVAVARGCGMFCPWDRVVRLGCLVFLGCSTTKEVVLTPVVISRNKDESVLIESSINSVRVSIKIKQKDDLEMILVHKFSQFLMQRAEQFLIMRRKPVGVRVSACVARGRMAAWRARACVSAVCPWRAAGPRPPLERWAPLAPWGPSACLWASRLPPHPNPTPTPSPSPMPTPPLLCRTTAFPS